MFGDYAGVIKLVLLGLAAALVVAASWFVVHSVIAHLEANGRAAQLAIDAPIIAGLRADVTRIGADLAQALRINKDNADEFKKLQGLYDDQTKYVKLLAKQKTDAEAALRAERLRIAMITSDYDARISELQIQVTQPGDINASCKAADDILRSVLRDGLREPATK